MTKEQQNVIAFYDRYFGSKDWRKLRNIKGENDGTE